MGTREDVEARKDKPGKWDLASPSLLPQASSEL